MHSVAFDESDLPPELKRLEDDYVFVRELGRGGTAVVYLARERRTGQAVAVKVIDRRYVEDPDAMSRFAREARTAAALDHPNIVRLLAVKQVGERTLAIVRQYVAGGTLRDALAGGAFSYRRAAEVLLDVAEALRYAHAQGIVHRDVKPENIFLDADTGRALLSDFGIARSVDGDSRVTVTGGTIGTPAYMSPEQIEGKAVNGRSDLYSLGLVGWEMLAGKRPWEGEGVYSVIYKQIHEELPRLTTLRDDIPEPLLFAIEGALHKHPDTRWANADEFIAELAADGPAARPAARDEAADDGDDLPTVRFRRPFDIGAPDAELWPTAAPSTAGIPPDLASFEDEPFEAEPSRRSRNRRILLVAGTTAAVLVAFAVALGSRTNRTDRQARADRGAEFDSVTTAARGGAVGPERTQASQPPAATPPEMLDTTAGNAGSRPGDSAGRGKGGRVVAANTPAPPAVEPRPRDSASLPAGSRTTAAGAAVPRPSPAAVPAAATPARVARSRADSLRLCPSPAAADQRACLFAHISVSDAELNRVYRAVIAEMRQIDGVAAGAPDPDSVRRLRAEQRAWLEYRDAECRRRTRGTEGALWAPVRARCFEQISGQRAHDLSQTLAVLKRMRRP